MSLSLSTNDPILMWKQWATPRKGKVEDDHQLEIANRPIRPHQGKQTSCRKTLLHSVPSGSSHPTQHLDTNLSRPQISRICTSLGRKSGKGRERDHSQAQEHLFTTQKTSWREILHCPPSEPHQYSVELSLRSPLGRPTHFPSLSAVHFPFREKAVSGLGDFF